MHHRAFTVVGLICVFASSCAFVISNICKKTTTSLRLILDTKPSWLWMSSFSFLCFQTVVFSLLPSSSITALLYHSPAAPSCFICTAPSIQLFIEKRRGFLSLSVCCHGNVHEEPAAPVCVCLAIHDPVLLIVIGLCPGLIQKRDCVMSVVSVSLRRPWPDRDPHFEKLWSQLQRSQCWRVQVRHSQFTPWHWKCYKNVRW